jgi:hypothetical protein
LVRCCGACVRLQRVVGWRLELLVPSHDEQRARGEAMHSGRLNRRNRENVRYKQFLFFTFYYLLCLVSQFPFL